MRIRAITNDAALDDAFPRAQSTRILSRRLGHIAINEAKSTTIHNRGRVPDINVDSPLGEAEYSVEA